MERVIYISDVAVRVETPGAPNLAEELYRRWAGCARPIIPPTRQSRIYLETVPGGFRCLVDDHEYDALVPPRLALKALESCIYDQVRGWHQRAGWVLLHAGLVSRDNRGLLFLGPSGAGKSSMCLAALENGWDYHSDDLVVTDGDRLWGIPRALQFDTEAGDTTSIPRLAHLDRHAWDLAIDAPTLYQPARIVEPDRQGHSPLSLSCAYPVVVEHGRQDRVVQLGPGRAIEALISASYDWPQHDLRWPRLLRPGFELTWCEPQDGLRALSAVIERL